jgi:hypothetical protein
MGRLLGRRYSGLRACSAHWLVSMRLLPCLVCLAADWFRRKRNNLPLRLRSSRELVLSIKSATRGEEPKRFEGFPEAQNDEVGQPPLDEASD